MLDESMTRISMDDMQVAVEKQDSAASDRIYNRFFSQRGACKAQVALACPHLLPNERDTLLDSHTHNKPMQGYAL